VATNRRVAIKWRGLGREIQAKPQAGLPILAIFGIRGEI
jgi:hypothetical protein